jgi:two-component sensor histidine kinase
MNGDGHKDMVFAISAGHSRQPRNVFLYDIQNDSLQVSPRSGAFIGYLAMDDLDEDGYDEVLAGTFASSNYNDEPMAYTDTSSWAMVYDHDLQFLFPPVEYPSPTGGVQLLPFYMPDGTKRIIGNAVYGPLENKKKKTFISDLTGKILARKDFEINDPFFNVGLIPNPKGRDPHRILGSLEKVGFYEIDRDLDIRKISNAKFASRTPSILDIDQDGEEEIIYISQDHKSHVILRSDMSGPVEIDFPIQSVMPLFSVKLAGGLPPQLSVSGDQVWKLFSYGINPLYRFRILIYLAIYLSILGFILLIRRLYAIQLKRKYETEKKITALQLSSIKAQMEPHFIFNVINSIGSSIYREKKDEAYQMVVRFSNMVRTLLSTSDQLYRTLHEEIEFVTNFLELEKQRFPELFDYFIQVDSSINRELLVPKMILQLHTENALKHGLRPRGLDGKLELTISQADDYLVLVVKDNGIGRKASASLMSASTGKGMKMLSQLFETYNKHNPKPVLQEITDLFDEEGQPAGTAVTIRVPVEFNAEIF